MARCAAFTSFEHILIYGLDVERTAYGDGFDTGDILVKCARDRKGYPEFLCVIGREGDAIAVAEVGTVTSVPDLADVHDGRATPALGVTVRQPLRYRIDGGKASLPDGGGAAYPWDGRGIHIAV